MATYLDEEVLDLYGMSDGDLEEGEDTEDELPQSDDDDDAE